LIILPESLRYLDWQPLVDDTPPETVKAYHAQLTPLLLNMALTALKITPPTTRNAEDAHNSTTRVLEMDDVSVTDKAKALYRRALAKSQLQDDDDAEKDLVEALNIAPGDEAVRRELEKVRQRRKEKREKQKKAYKGLFS
jgi:peptidyl-prolyl isomerase D